jgi:integrase
MAAVRKRKWKHKDIEREAWVVDYVDGEGKRRLRTFERKKDADLYRSQVEVEVVKGEHIAHSVDVPFKLVAEAWLAKQRRSHLTTGKPVLSSMKAMEWVLESHLNPRFASQLISKLSAEAVQDYLNEASARYAHKTLRYFRSVLAGIIKHGIKTNRLKRNVLLDGGVKVPGRQKRMTIPSRSDLLKLLEATERKSRREADLLFLQRRCFVLLALFCGMRMGEICALRWRFIDFEKGIISIRHSYSRINGLKDPKTAAGSRDVSMPANVQASLEALRDKIGDEPDAYPFVTAVTGKNLRDSFDTLVWRPLMTKAGLTVPDTKCGFGYDRGAFGFHALRHASVSLLIDAGLSSVQIQRFIGHENANTTLGIYGHLFPEDDGVAKTMAGLALHFRPKPSAPAPELV